MLLALCALGCMPVLHAHELVWCEKSNTMSFRITDLLEHMPYEECNLEPQANTSASLVEFGGDVKLKPNHPCFLRYKHAACEKYGYTPTYDPDADDDKCVRVFDDGTEEYVEIKYDNHNRDSITVHVQQKGTVTCDEDIKGIWLLRAEHANAFNGKGISFWCPSDESCILVSQSKHMLQAQKEIEDSSVFFQDVLEYENVNPYKLYRRILNYRNSKPNETPKYIIFMLDITTVPPIKMLQRVADLLKAESVISWFNHTCTEGDYESEVACQKDLNKMWKEYGDLTWKSCPANQEQIVQDLNSTFGNMSLWLQQTSSWWAGCGNYSLNDTEMLRDFGCDTEIRPLHTQPDFVACKKQQIIYASWIKLVVDVFLVTVAVILMRVGYNVYIWLQPKQEPNMRGDYSTSSGKGGKGK